LGLPFALFAAGNANTVLTLWQIFDGSTAEFTERFFGKIKAGVSMALALSATKREFICGDAGQERRSPAYWAPFVLYGGPQDESVSDSLKPNHA
jgi:CHAT domain-containing protein